MEKENNKNITSDDDNPKEKENPKQEEKKSALEIFKEIIPFKKSESRFEQYKQPSDFKLEENGGVAGVHCIEDIIEIIGFHGKWNIICFLMICIHTFVGPMNNITYQFLGATPDHWCHMDELIEANWTQQQIIDVAIPLRNDTKYKYEGCKYYNQNYTLAVELGYDHVMKNPKLIKLNSSEQFVTCYKRDYNTSQYDSTVVIEWDLVCENRAYYSTTQSASQIGFLFGALSAGIFLERFGRRRIIMIGCLIRTITSFGAALAPYFSFYVIMRIMLAASGMCAYSGLFILAMEVSSISQRSSVGALMGIPWGIGYMITPGIAYLIRSWRWLQATFSCFTFLSVAYIWFLPESPRWLIFRGHYEKAIELLDSAAKMNKRPLPPKEALIISMRAMAPKEKETNESLSQKVMKKIKYFLTLVRKPRYLKKILVSFYCWFAVAMVYYGVSLNSENLSTDPYIYLFLGGLLEIPSYLFKWAILALLGRRTSLTGLYITTTVTIATIAALLATVEEVNKGLLIFLSLAGKVAITAAFKVCYVFTAELFPTAIRPLAVGQSSMVARFGSISSPYINDILGDFIPWAPSALFACVSFVGAILVHFLPETGGSILMENQTSTKGNTDQEQGTQMKEAKVNKAYEEDSSRL